jgi:hypothetical protein
MQIRCVHSGVRQYTTTGWTTRRLEVSARWTKVFSACFLLAILSLLADMLSLPACLFYRLKT